MTASRVASDRRGAVAALSLVVVVVAGCGVPGQTGEAGTPAIGPDTPSALSSPTADQPSPAPSHSAGASPAAEPPAAVLAGLAGGPAAGDLGSYSWDGLVSDSPWIVERSGQAVAAGSRLQASFDGSLDQVAWTARWAPIRRRQPGKPRAAGSGQDGRMVVDAPSDAGPWSLQLQATFGDGRRAVWYWRVEVDG